MTWLAVAACTAIFAALAALAWLLCRKPVPELNCAQRQAFALLSLFLGEVALTGLWVGLYLFEWLMHDLGHGHATISEEGQQIIWRLMAIHAGSMAVIAIGDIVSARIGDWFEIKRGES